MKLAPVFAAAALLVSSLSFAPAARAGEVEVQNDKFSGMGMLDFGGQLDPGEGVSETFDVPERYLPFTVTKVRFIAGPTGGAKLTFVLYEDMGAAAPGKELARVAPKDEIEGTDMIIQEVDLPPTVINKGAVSSLKMAIFTDRQSFPAGGGVSIPKDNNSPGNGRTGICINKTMGKPCEWIYARTFPGFKGTWIIRLVGETDAVSNPMPDGGGGGGKDMGGGTGPGPGVLSVTTLIPATFPQGQGGSALIRGTGFAEGLGVVLKGDKGPEPLTRVSRDDDKTISIGVPDNLAAGLYDVQVKNPDGQSATLPKALTISADTLNTSKGGCSAAFGGGSAYPFVGGALLLLPLLRRRRRGEPPPQARS